MPGNERGAPQETPAGLRQTKTSREHQPSASAGSKPFPKYTQRHFRHGIGRNMESLLAWAWIETAKILNNLYNYFGRAVKKKTTGHTGVSTLGRAAKQSHQKKISTRKFYSRCYSDATAAIAIFCGLY